MPPNAFKLTKLTEFQDFPKWYVDLRDYCKIHDILQYYDLPPIGKKSETIQADRPIAPRCPEAPPPSADLAERGYFDRLLALYQETDKIYQRFITKEEKLKEVISQSIPAEAKKEFPKEATIEVRVSSIKEFFHIGDPQLLRDIEKKWLYIIRQDLRKSNLRKWQNALLKHHELLSLWNSILVQNDHDVDYFISAMKDFSRRDGVHARIIFNKIRREKKSATFRYIVEYILKELDLLNLATYKGSNIDLDVSNGSSSNSTSSKVDISADDACNGMCNYRSRHNWKTCRGLRQYVKYGDDVRNLSTKRKAACKTWLQDPSKKEKAIKQWKSTETPMKTRPAKAKEEEQALLLKSLITKYQACAELARHTLLPTQEHIDAADDLIRYLLETRNIGIQYGPNGPSDDRSDDCADDQSADFVCFSDAPFADDVDDRKSSQGYVMEFVGGPMMLKPGRQDTLTTSSAEAENLAISAAGKEQIRMQRIFDDMALSLEDVGLYM